MGLIVEYTIETPILEHALAAVPEMVLHTETIDVMRDGRLRSVVRARGGDFRAFERRLGEDPTVGEFELLTDLDDRRLYRVTFSEAGKAAVTYPVLAEHDAVMLDSTGTREGLEIRARFPSRDALAAYREACRERDVPFHLRALYREEALDGEDLQPHPHGLTDPQREVLLRALEMGYFDVPRRTTLEEIAAELGVSNQAVSTRLRRGLETLLRRALT